MLKLRIPDIGSLRIFDISNQLAPHHQAVYIHDHSASLGT